VIHSRSSSVVTSIVSDEMTLEVDSSPRKHIYSSSSRSAGRQTVQAGKQRTQSAAHHYNRT
jgi:hypothetical protein